MFDEESGFGPRKRVGRSTEERAAIVAETYVPGATVAGVAKKHGIVASKLSTWRTAAKKKASASKPQDFAEITVLRDVPFDGIEIVAAGVTVRLPKSTAAKRIGDIARALRG